MTVRVNLGCGDRYADGWVNVDRVECPHRKDAVVDLTQTLPLDWWQENGVVEYAYAGHVLEHLTIDQCCDVLDRLWLCMIPGGQVMVVGPDVDVAERMIVDGTFDHSYGHTLDTIRNGGGRWPGDEHRWWCTAERVAAMLRDTGWSDVTNVGIGNVDPLWPVADRRPLWQCAVSAIRE